jgi:hypothetical protein
LASLFQVVVENKGRIGFVWHVLLFSADDLRTLPTQGMNPLAGLKLARAPKYFESLGAYVVDFVDVMGV